MQLFDVIKRPLVTEKNTSLQAQGKYAFEVTDDANKVMVKEAVEKAFKVTVTVGQYDDGARKRKKDRPQNSNGQSLEKSGGYSEGRR